MTEENCQETMLRKFENGFLLCKLANLLLAQRSSNFPHSKREKKDMGSYDGTSEAREEAKKKHGAQSGEN